MGVTSSAPGPYSWPDKTCRDDGTVTLRATLGAGCYWGTESYIKKWGAKSGEVVSAHVGFMGGAIKNPSYEQVCSGSTGHVEVADVVLSDVKGKGAAVLYEELLQTFFMFHDPTTLNRQGNDVGTQYASVSPTQIHLSSVLICLTVSLCCPGYLCSRRRAKKDRDESQIRASRSHHQRPRKIQWECCQHGHRCSRRFQQSNVVSPGVLGQEPRGILQPPHALQIVAELDSSEAACILGKQSL